MYKCSVSFLSGLKISSLSVYTTEVASFCGSKEQKTTRNQEDTNVILLFLKFVDLPIKIKKKKTERNNGDDGKKKILCGPTEAQLMRQKGIESGRQHAFLISKKKYRKKLTGSPIFLQWILFIVDKVKKYPHLNFFLLFQIKCFLFYFFSNCFRLYTAEDSRCKCSF